MRKNVITYDNDIPNDIAANYYSYGFEISIIDLFHDNSDRASAAKKGSGLLIQFIW